MTSNAQRKRNRKAPRTPTLTMIGDVALVTLGPICTLHPAHFARVAVIEAKVAAGEGPRASRLALALEADLGVTTADRIAAAQPSEPWEADLAAAFADLSAPPAAPIRPEPIELPAEERGLPPEQVERYDQAREDLNNPRLRLSDKQRDARAATMGVVERRPIETRDREWRERTEAETAALAVARGEEVGRTKAGGLRIMSRGGLQQAYEDGHLDPVHGKLTATDMYEAAKAYRNAYEAYEGQTTGGKEGGGGFSSKGPQLRVLKAGVMLAQMREALTPQQQAVIDLVCGQDVRLRAAATQLGRGFPATRNALRGGLRAIVEQGTEAPEDFAEHLRAKAAAIAQAERAA